VLNQFAPKEKSLLLKENMKLALITLSQTLLVKSVKALSAKSQIKLFYQMENALTVPITLIQALTENHVSFVVVSLLDQTMSFRKTELAAIADLKRVKMVLVKKLVVTVLLLMPKTESVTYAPLLQEKS
jgi:hypothetical protein